MSNVAKKLITKDAVKYLAEAVIKIFNIVAYLCHARTVTLKHAPAITQQ
jgi:hypothetical protein